MKESDLKVIEQHKQIILSMVKSVKSMTSAMTSNDPSRHTNNKERLQSAQALLDIHHRYKVEANFSQFESVYVEAGNLLFKEELEEYYKAKDRYYFVLEAISEVAKQKKSVFKFW